MAGVAWGQRKALGKRYAIDPALMLAQDQMAQEYALTPGREARALSASQFDRNLALDEEKMNQAGKAGLTSGLMNTGMTAAMLYKLGGGEFGSILPAIKSGALFGSGATGAGTAAYGAGAIGGTALGEAAGISALGGAGATVAPALVDAGLAEAAAIGSTAIGQSAGISALGGAAAPAAGSTIGSTAIGQSAGISELGGGAAAGAGLAYAGPALAGYAAPKIIDAIHKDSMENVGHNITFGTVSHEKTAKTVGSGATGAAAGALAGAAATSWSGPGAIVGAVIGGLAGALGADCIIVTACTDPYSYEVKISRIYRDTYLDKDQLRGYYFLAEIIVPFLERNEKLRKNVKRWLVDKLVDYGEHRIGLKTRSKPLSFIVSKLFLGAIKAIGMILPVYVRRNREVY